MQEEIITITEYCTHYHTDIAFIEALEHNGIISLVWINNERCLHYDQLQEIETYTRLHDELNINVEGIDTIHHLLEKIKQLQEEIIRLKGYSSAAR